MYNAAYAPVAQLDRALPSEGRGQRFESSRVRQFLCFTIANQLMFKHFLCLLWIGVKRNEKQICMSPCAAS